MGCCVARLSALHKRSTERSSGRESCTEASLCGKLERLMSACWVALDA